MRISALLVTLAVAAIGAYQFMPGSRASTNIGVVEDLAEQREKTQFAEVDATPGERAEDSKSRRIAYLLDQAVDRLSDGEAKDLRAEFRSLIDERKALVDAKNRAEFDSASGASGGIGAAIESAKSVIGMAPADPVKAAEAKIGAVEEKIKGVKERLRASLEKVGVTVTTDQLDGLLVMATADSFIDMMAAYANLRAIDEMLKQASDTSNESLGTARRYYGLHASLTEIAGWMQESFVAEIDTKFLPELERIEAEAEALRKEAGKLLGDNPDAAKVLEANVAAQDLTIKTVNIYRRELTKQRDAMAAAAAKTARQAAVAINTWRTVKVSSDLVAAMRATDEGFRQLLTLEIPDLRPFQGVELKAEFQRISTRLVATAE